MAFVCLLFLVCPNEPFFYLPSPLLSPWGGWMRGQEIGLCDDLCSPMMNKPSLANTLMCGLIARSLALVMTASQCITALIACFVLCEASAASSSFPPRSIRHSFTHPSVLLSKKSGAIHPSLFLYYPTQTRPRPFYFSAIDHKVEQRKGQGIISGQLALCRSDSLQIRSSVEDRRGGKKIHVG